MAENTQTEEIDLKALATQDAAQDEEAQEKPEPKATKTYADRQEQKARGGGRVSEDEWIDAGKAAEDWVSAEAFNIRGEFIGKLKSKDREIEERLSGVNKIVEAQKAVIRDFRKAAIENGDVRAVEGYDKQIANLNIQQAPSRNTELDDWNAKNAWIFEESPKSVYARHEYQKAKMQGMDDSNALILVETKLKSSFPENTPKRSVPETEKGHGNRGFKTPSRTLSMGDLTQDELAIKAAFPDAWKDDKEFLRAVADTRGSK